VLTGGWWDRTYALYSKTCISNPYARPKSRENSKSQSKAYTKQQDFAYRLAAAAADAGVKVSGGSK
jgi:hypothetical protein